MICQCGHGPEDHFGSFVYSDNKIDYTNSQTQITNCGRNHNYFDLSLGCHCRKFKIDNLKYLENILQEKEKAHG